MIYLHVPFCHRKCTYCAFYSKPAHGVNAFGRYVDALLAEMEQRKGEQAHPIRTVYFGGGTPSILPLAELARIVDGLRRSFDLSQVEEFTLEANPEVLTPDYLSDLISLGFNRLSVGIQSLDDAQLRLIGRRHTARQTEEAYRLARDMGFDHINMDLIAGLPGENLEKFSQTLHWVRDLAPESMTVHTLSIKRSSLLHLWQAQLPEGGMVADMVRAGADMARQMGMRPYYLYRQKYMAGNQENVGYALPRHECLYNIDMMEETASVVALGAGSASKRLFPQQGFIRRAFNVSDIRQYIDRVDEMAERKKALFGENTDQIFSSQEQGENG